MMQSDVPGIDMYCCDRRFNDKYRMEREASYLTNLTLECLQWCLDEKKNMILAYPEATVRPVSLMAYLATESLDKASIIFTRDLSGSGGAVNQHVATYSLLEHSSKRNFLYKLSPLGELLERRNGMELRLAVDMSRVGNRYYRKKYEDSLRANLHRSPNMIVISSESHSEVVDYLDAVKLRGETLGKDVKLEIGSLFFENVDRMVNSRYTHDSFLTWVQNLVENEGMFLFAHFANPYSPFIAPLASELDAVVLHFGRNFALNNADLLKPNLLQHFESKSFSKLRKATTISMLLLDSPDLWSGQKPPEVSSPLADAGNLDSMISGLIKNGRMVMSKGPELLRMTLGSLVKLAGNLRKLSVHPCRLKLPYRFEDGRWRTVDLNHHLELTSKRISGLKDSEIQRVAQSFLRDFKTLCDELSKTARFGGDDDWTRKGKPYWILKFISRWSQENEDGTLIVAVRDYRERRLLANDLREIIGSENVEIRLIGNIAVSAVSPGKKDLLLPFPLSTRNFSEYLKPYNSIRIIAYDGHEAEVAKEHIEIISQAYSESENLSISHLKRTFRKMYLDPECNALYGRILKIERIAETTEEEIPVEPETMEPPGIELKTIEERIRGLIDTSKEFPLSKEEKDIEEELEAIEEPIESEEEEIVGEKVVLELRSIDTRRVREVSLRPRRSIITTIGKSTDADIREIPAEELNDGDLVILPFGETRRDMTDIVVELFSDDKDVDTELLTYWKETLCDYKSENALTFSELYEAYKEQARLEGLDSRAYATVLHWTKEWRIAPQYVDDLRILGKLANDDYLFENAQNTSDDAEKMRTLRRMIGRLMNKVIREILVGKRSVRDKSYEEATLANLVRQSLFEVVSIDHVME